MENSNKFDRYNRQILLREFGVTAQEKLSVAKVLVVGACGLGCPALQYLAAAGVGALGIVDFDTIELSNLQRQTLYNAEDVGRSKAMRAAEVLQKFNPDIQLLVHHLKLVSKNALDIVVQYDIVLDGTDNFSTRYLVNDACVILNKPLVYGAVLRFEGQVGVFNFTNKHLGYTTNYRDLFPVPPLPSTVPSCNEAGVIGVLPGIIGALQAAEAIKMITGIGEPLCNKILSYNMLTNRFYEFELTPANVSDKLFPKNRLEFEYFDYDWFCGMKADGLEITINDFDELKNDNKISIVDVREYGELPSAEGFPCIRIPLSQLKNSPDVIPAGDTTIVFCQSGKRSLIAVKLLKEIFPQRKMYSLKGGIEAWEKYRLKPSAKQQPIPENKNR